jgi:hypothetical protein
VTRGCSSAACAGQASVELVACAGMLVIVGLLGFQLLAAGYAAVMADHSAQAAATALLNGRPGDEAAREAVPGWPERNLVVRRSGDRVSVTLEPPSPLRLISGHLAVTGEAVVPALRRPPSPDRERRR